MPVQHIHQRKADSRETESVDRMQHRIPVGHAHIELVDFPQDRCCEDEDQQEYLQGARQLNPQLSGQDAGEEQQEEGNRRDKDRFIIPAED